MVLGLHHTQAGAVSRGTTLCCVPRSPGRGPPGLPMLHRNVWAMCRRPLRPPTPRLLSVPTDTAPLQARCCAHSYKELVPRFLVVSITSCHTCVGAVCVPVFPPSSRPCSPVWAQSDPQRVLLRGCAAPSDTCVLCRDVRQRVQLAIAQAFGISASSLYLTKPTFFSRINSTEARTAHDEYWHAHVDKVRLSARRVGPQHLAPDRGCPSSALAGLASIYAAFTYLGL